MTTPMVSRPRLAMWLAAALLPFALVVGARWTQPPGEAAGDYAQYLLHAKALAEGRPYSDIGFIHTDLNLVGPRNQPPGWPLVLAPVVAAFGVDTPLIKLLVVLLVAGFGFTAGLYVARRAGPTAGFCVAMMVPLALETQRATSTAISDPLACFLIWVALLVADRDGHSGRRMLLLAAVASFAVLVRVASVGVVAALTLFLTARYLRLEYRAKWSLLAAAMTLLALVVFGSAEIPLIGDFVAGQASFSFNPARTVETYRHALAASVLYPLPSGAGNDIWQVLVALPVVIGAGWFVAMQAGSIAWWFLFMYGALLVVSPLREPRYAWPLVPLVAVWLVLGFTFIAGWLERLTGSRWRLRRAVPVVVVAVSIAAAFQLMRAPAPQALQNDPLTMALFDTIKGVRAPDGSPPRVAFSNPRVLTLLTSVSAMGLPNASVERVLEEFDRKGITHVAVPLEPHTLLSEGVVEGVITAKPERFEIVYQNARYRLYRVLGVQTPPG